MGTTEESRVGNTVRLRDGRALGYAEFGDLTGKPVLMMHGFPDSRITRNPDDALTASLGVRLIIVDRPGTGLSDFKPARSLLDRVDDVAQLTDELGLDRFAVLGWSAGGPYALACAHILARRISAVGVACGFAPVDRPGATEGMPKNMRRFIPLLRRMPWVARPMMASLAKQYMKDPGKAFQKQFGGSMSEVDARVMDRPEIRRNMLDGAAEAMRQGSKGPASEVQLLFARAWGFRPGDIETEVWLWYGDADALVPLSTGRYLAEAIPNSRLVVCPGEGHMLFVTRWEEILSTLVSHE